MNLFNPNDIPHVKGYATCPKLGIVAVLTEDMGGMTLVARWVRTDILTNSAKHLIDEVPDE